MKIYMKNNGFTIVELLIVIVVIGILAAITITAYNGVQARARFAKVQQDLASMQKVLEIYKADVGTYPSTSGAWSYSSTNPTSFIPSVVPTYTSSLPRFTGDFGQYVYLSTNAEYKLIRLGQPALTSGEQALIPATMKDQYNGSDRYGVWSAGGATF
jgi:type II secretion system protein G